MTASEATVDDLLDPGDPLFEALAVGLEPHLGEPVPATGVACHVVAANSQDPAKERLSAGANSLITAEQLSAAGTDVASQLPGQQLEQTDKRQSKLSRSRESQKRCRERQKARSISLQTQLVTTTAEVESLRAQLHQSQARTLLLEKVASLNKQDQPEQPAQTFWDKLKAGRMPEMHSEAGPSVPVTVFGSVYMMPISEISKLTQPQFSNIILEYMRPLASALLDLDGSSHPAPAAVDAMQQLAIECGEFMCALVNFNVSSATVLYTGQLFEGGSESSPLTHSQYCLLVKLMSLSEPQVKDLLELRQLHIARRNQLAAERKALMHQITEPTDQAWLVRENVSKVASMGEALKENAAQDYQIDAEVQCAVLRGIVDIHQFAVMLVHAFPVLPATRELLDAVVSVNREQSLQSANAAPILLVDGMKKLDRYLKAFTANCQKRYVPYRVTHTSDSTEPLTRQRFIDMLDVQ